MNTLNAQGKDQFPLITWGSVHYGEPDIRLATLLPAQVLKRHRIDDSAASVVGELGGGRTPGQYP